MSSAESVVASTFGNPTRHFLAEDIMKSDPHIVYYGARLYCIVPLPISGSVVAKSAIPMPKSKRSRNVSAGD